MTSKDQGLFGHRTVPAFSPSVDLFTAALVQLPPIKAYPVGTRFIEQGQTPNSVKLIRSGIVKLIHTNPDGGETTLGLRSDGWWMSASAVIVQVDSLATVVSVTNATMSSLSIEEFKAAINRDPVLKEHFIVTQCRELLMMEQFIIMQGQDATTRLRSLYAEAETSAWNTADPMPVLRQSEVASLLAITPEHLSRIKSKSTNPK
jgi:CRP-like cAMP-binding protein